MFQWARTLLGIGTAKSAGEPIVRARYDNALTVDENRRSWFGADYLSAKSANNFQVRRMLRMRSRYEVSNNPYLFGVCNSNADDLIGTGPTLQVKTSDEKYNRDVQRSFDAWWTEVAGNEKLRTQKLAKSVDGEGFLVLKTVEDLEHEVKLYPVDIEADQVTNPGVGTLKDLWIDGLELHPVTGRPTAYHVLKHHPGDYYFPSLNPFEVAKVSAKYVLHWFHRFRPGQVRGLPIFTPSLDMFGDLRSYRKSVLGSAQIAANFTAVGEQDLAAAPGDDEDDDAEYQPFKRVPIDRGMLMMLPPGVKMSGFDPKQPTTSYGDFQEKCLGEAVRPLAYPLNLVLGTSQKFNFSSAKLDHINYRTSLTVERSQCEEIVLIPLFRAWFVEAVLCGAIPMRDGLVLPPIEWHWPGFESLDPAVDADADQVRIAGGQLTLQEFWARRGKDWKDVLTQLSIERKEIERLGLKFGDVVKRSVTVTADTDKDDAEAEVANAA
jgi:lambda family phage portal protein